MTSQKSRRVGWLAGLVLSACGLGTVACGGSNPAGAPQTARYASAPCPNPIVDGVPQIDLGPTFECGYLTVPENRSRADGRSLQIPVARIRATAAHPASDPILYLAGGPGGTGLASAVQRVAAGWNADRDVIFIDQRGTLKAKPLLACPEIDAFLADAVHDAAIDPATRLRSAAATRQCHDRLIAEGHDLGAFATPENAADIADLRIALGIAQWNVYGVSYGTDLALQTLRDHPAGIRSLVLDSLVPPQKNLMEGFWPNAAEGYRAMFDACAAERACASAFPNVEAEFHTLVHSLSLSPRRVDVIDPTTGQSTTVVIDGYTLANLLVVASLVPGSVAKLPALVHDLAAGSGRLAAAAVLNNRPPTGLTGYGLTLGVFCSEQVALTSAEQALGAARAALPNFPPAVLNLLPQAPYIFSDCAEWRVPRAADQVRAPAHSTIPVLLLAGTLDAITPPSWADAAASTLPNARVVHVTGAGHDVMLWSPACAVTVMRNFLNQPSGFDDACVGTLTVPPFAAP